jgi:spore maturation protein SpmA
MPEVNAAGIDSAKQAVTIAIGLLGMMALWLGFMRVLQDAGVLSSIARAVAPVMRRLFPDVPSEHPAMGAMIMNVAANMVGVGNAATPFGLKAMQELNKLNSRRGVASDSMVLFLAINTSGVAVLPLGVIAIRASLDSQDAAGIIIPSILATMCSTIVAVVTVKAIQGLPIFSLNRYPAQAENEDVGSEASGRRPSRGRSLLLAVFALLMLFAAYQHVTADRPEEGAKPVAAAEEPATPNDDGGPVERDDGAGLSSWMLPVLMAFIVLFGFTHRVKVYESLVKGAREGFEIFIMIIPFLVAILVAVGMFRASGALGWLIDKLEPVTSLVGFPPEAVLMAFTRPLSGSGAMGVMTETMTQYGPDSFVGFLVSVMNGSTETTFYVLALYLGSVQVRAARHAVAACLAADAAGMAGALLWCRLFF